MNTYTLSQTRTHLSKLIESVNKKGTQFSITVNGVVAATVVSQEDYDNLMETLEILQDKEILNDIVESEKEFKEGKYKTLTNKIKKNVRSSNNSKSRKTSQKTA